MMLARRAIFILSLLCSIAGPAAAQAPAPVPALPDAERRTSYTISSSTCACAVNFALYGDGTDYQNWVEVWLNGVRVNYNDSTYGWTITSPSGSIAALARPITNAVLTFSSAQTGTVQIVGARRPRRTAQFTENQGVAARDLNLALTDIISQSRENWDKANDMTGRGLFFAPGNTTGPMPLPSACANGFLGFDATGLNPVCRTGAGSGNVVGPGTATAGDAVVFGSTPNVIVDAGAPPVLTTRSIGTTSPLTGGGDLSADRTIAFSSQSANTVLAGPTTGGPAAPGFRSLVGADLPAPSASTLGGVKSLTCSSNNWFNTLSTAGLLGCSQPAFSSLTGSMACSQAPALTGDVTTSAGSCATSIASSAVTNAKLANAADGTIKSNISGGSAAPSDNTITAVLDKLFGTTQGSVVYRGASTWAALSPGSSGQLLSSGGAGANPTWITASGTGTVTSVTGGTGLSGGVITTTGTLAVNLATAANSLAADVTISSTGTFFDGPSMAQGTSGTWHVSGTVTLGDTNASPVQCKLWDGSTVIASGYTRLSQSGTAWGTVSLSGNLASPAGNIRISCRCDTATSVKMYANQSGAGKDSTVSGFRIQ